MYDLWLTFHFIQITYRLYFLTNVCVKWLGYYYIVDARYLNAEGFLAPYRETRYHLLKWRDRCAL